MHLYGQYDTADALDKGFRLSGGLRRHIATVTQFGVVHWLVSTEQSVYTFFNIAYTKPAEIWRHSARARQVQGETPWKFIASAPITMSSTH